MTYNNPRRPLPAVDWRQYKAIVHNELEGAEPYTSLAIRFLESRVNAIPYKHFAKLEGLKSYEDIWGLFRGKLRMEALFHVADAQGQVLLQRMREEEADRRALRGVKKPVFHRGRICGHVREYSDSLLVTQMKANAPEKYAERKDVRHSGAVLNLQIDGVRSQHDRTVDPIYVTDDVEVEAPETLEPGSTPEGEV